METSNHSSSLVVKIAVLDAGGRAATTHRRRVSRRSFNMGVLLDWLSAISPSFSSITWVDEDGDDIFIKNDDDLLEASRSRGDLLLLNVKAAPFSKVQPERQPRRSRRSFFARSQTVDLRHPQAFARRLSQTTEHGKAIPAKATSKADSSSPCSVIKAQNGTRPSTSHGLSGSSKEDSVVPEKQAAAVSAPLLGDDLSDELVKGDKVFYFRKYKRGEPFNQLVAATVAKVHRDEVPFYYTIKLEEQDGDEASEIQTERPRLTKAPAGAATTVPAREAMRAGARLQSGRRGLGFARSFTAASAGGSARF